jgi:hypothetical protein
MGAFDGLTRAGAQVVDLTKKVENLNTSMGEVVTNFENGSTVVKGFAASMTILADIQKEIQAGYASRPDKPTTPKDFDQRVANQLEAFAGRIKSVFGEDNFFAGVLENEAK